MTAHTGQKSRSANPKYGGQAEQNPPFNRKNGEKARVFSQAWATQGTHAIRTDPELEKK